MDDAIQKIEAARERQGLTQAAAAKAAGIAQPNWHYFVRGSKRPTWDTLSRMAAAVGLRVEITVKRAKKTSRKNDTMY